MDLMDFLNFIIIHILYLLHQRTGETELYSTDTIYHLQGIEVTKKGN